MIGKKGNNGRRPPGRPTRELCTRLAGPVDHSVDRYMKPSIARSTAQSGSGSLFLFFESNFDELGFFISCSSCYIRRSLHPKLYQWFNRLLDNCIGSSWVSLFEEIL